MEKLKDILFTKHFSIGKFKFSLEDLFCVIIMSFLAVLLLQNCATLFEITTWRNDDLYYIDEYYTKLTYEGRWIIYLFFFVLKKLSPYVVITLSFACFFFFGYKIAKEFIADEVHAIIFALALMQIHPIYTLVHWPATPFPNYVLLALAPLLKKVLSKRAFFICTGILFFGVFFNYYNLMPLLFLSEVKDRKSFVQIMLWWIIGFLAGYAVAQVITFAKVGAFIHVHIWRDPHPIESFADVFRNIGIEYRWLCTGLKGFFATRSVRIVFACMLADLIYLTKKNDPTTGGRSGMFARVALILAVIASLYVQQIPVGVLVKVRTAFPLYCGLFCLALFCYNKKTFRSIAIILLSIVATVFWQDNINDLQWYNVITNTWRTELMSVCSAPSLHKGIKVYLQGGKNAEIAQSMKIICKANNKTLKYTSPLDEDFRWLPVAKSIGFKHVELYNEELPAKFAKISPNGLYRYGYEDGYLYLTIDKKYLDQFED